MTETTSETSTTTGVETVTSTTEPTTTEPTTGSTTSPPPACEVDSDCEGYCAYCIEGECYEGFECCGLVPGPGGGLELRCIGYECYSDDECGEGSECDGPPGFCIELTPLPVCERQVLALSAIPLPGTASALHLVDLNGDTRLDLVAALPDAGEIAVLIGDGAGGFAAPTNFPTGLGPGAHRIASGDFDLDGDPDLALLRPAPVGELSLLFGQDAVFAKPVAETIGENPVALFVGDLDGDGAPDVLSLDQPAADPLSLRLGDGKGVLAPETGSPELAGEAFAAGLGELDGDTGRELATTQPGSPGLRSLSFQAGVGFVNEQGLPFKGGTVFDAVVIADLDGDGAAGVVGRRTLGAVDLLAHWSAGAGSEVSVAGGALLVGADDVDGDTREDVLAIAADPAIVRVVFASAQGQLECVQDHAVEEATTRELVVFGDVDGDGKADLVVGSAVGAQVRLLRSGP